MNQTTELNASNLPSATVATPASFRLARSIFLLLLLGTLVACSSSRKNGQHVTTIKTVDGATVTVDEGSTRSTNPTIVASDASPGKFDAVVTHVCSKRRLVRYTKLDGNKGEILVANSVDLSPVAVGDLVAIKFIHAVALKSRKDCQMVKSCCKSKSSKPQSDTCPASASLKVTQINQKKGTLRVQGDIGTLNLTVRDPERLAAVKRGDLLKVRYSQVYATSIAKRSPLKR